MTLLCQSNRHFYTEGQDFKNDYMIGVFESFDWFGQVFVARTCREMVTGNDSLNAFFCNVELSSIARRASLGVL